MTNEKNFNEEVKKVEKFLDLNKFCVVATADKDGVVSTSTVSFVRQNLTLFFQTDKTFEKIKNISENPNVAISVGAYNFKGKAEILGAPSKFENFLTLMNKKHPETVKSYSFLPNEVVVKVDLTQVKIWGIDSEKSAKNTEKILKIDIKNKICTEILCDKL